MPRKKKRKPNPPPTIHPRNKYSEKPPDFHHLASLYPSFKPFVFYSHNAHPRIDWTDFNATRELTRVLLHHDLGLNWWIPDGQLCPTVPNRSNYIHWIEDLLSDQVIPTMKNHGDKIRGFDIGTGANCIYPLLGASLLGWSFVGSDMTDIALAWARRNVESNPHLAELIEIRIAGEVEEIISPVKDETSTENGVTSEVVLSDVRDETDESLALDSSYTECSGMMRYRGPPILVGVVKEGESFDFCMCNPPFFKSIEEAGLNPRTSCGGTTEEMVCTGGEQAFISRIIEDSISLKQSFRWYTSMVGRKANLKVLVSKLREAGVSVVKTTEFVQGQTSRWGLAWSFISPIKKIIAPLSTHQKNNLSFMLEGLKRQFCAFQVLQSVELFFLESGASCKSDSSSFIVDVTISNEHMHAFLNHGSRVSSESAANQFKHELNGSSTFQYPSGELCFRISVFEQIPGTLLVRGSLANRENPLSGAFSSIFLRMEEALKGKFISKC